MSEVMQTMWGPGIFDAVILSVLLLAGQILKRKIPFLNTFLLPSAIIAGFLGLLLGSDGIGLIHLDQERLGVYVYHLLGLGFISLALKDREMTASRPIVKTGLFIVTVYLLQGIIGSIITITAAYTFLPDTFPSLGLLLPLGFGQGPGQAYSIGRSWESAGVKFGGSLGLTIATMGFVWATFGGVIAANILKKKYPPTALPVSPGSSGAQVSREVIANLFGEPETPQEEQGELNLSNMIDIGTRQLFLIGFIYLAVYLTLYGISMLLGRLGNVGANLANVLWGFHFVFGTMYAIIVKLAMARLRKRGVMHHVYNNNRILSRISGTSFDYMVAASIAAISVEVILDSWIILLLLTAAGGIITLWFSLYAARKVFKKDILEYTLGFFGTYTGTLSTGMALLRTVDPSFRTKVADHLVLGGGLALFFAFPLLLILNLPVIALTENKPEFHFYALAALVVYCALTAFFLFFDRKPKAR
ncbi:MAG: sodium:glutamate symporter [Spirochaetales bacterium]|nr:sodium:glutamate symporter [Spirochaetales bacterium]